MPKFMKIEISRTSTSWLNVAVPDGVCEHQVREAVESHLYSLIVAQLDGGMWEMEEPQIDGAADGSPGECRVEGCSIYNPATGEFTTLDDASEFDEWIEEQEEIKAERDAATPAPGQLRLRLDPDDEPEPTEFNKNMEKHGTEGLT